jgi:putative endopeptidase
MTLDKTIKRGIKQKRKPRTKRTNAPVKKFNTFQSIVSKNKDLESVNKIFTQYLKYKSDLKHVISDSNLIKETRRDDYYTYINEGWISHQEKKLKKQLKYYAQVDDFRMLQEKVYYELIDYVKTYIKHNPNSKKARAIENVYKCIYKTNKQIGLSHTKEVKDNVESFLLNNDMYGLLAYVNENEIYSWASPIVWNVLPDEKNVSKYISHISPGQLGVYDTTIYKDEPTDDANTKNFKKEFKTKYFKFIEDTFKTVLPNDYKDYNAQDIWDVEIELLGAMESESFTDKEDPDFYNVVTKEQLETTYGFDWTQFTNKLGYITPPNKVILGGLNFMKATTDLLKQKWNSPKWKTYWLFIFYKTMLRFEWDWNQIYYDFYAKFVQGQPVRFPRELYPIFALSFTFNTFLTEQYIEHNKDDLYINYVKNMAEDLKLIFINKIKRNTWLSPSTKTAALNKLTKLRLDVGNPDKLREDPILNYTTNDPWLNMEMLAKWRTKQFIKLEGQNIIDIPIIDWNELKLVGTQAYVVNAYYNPTSNSIYVPMAYLQKPFIDLDERGIEYNLAHVGYTLAHEFSHCLDDMGSRFDADGNLHDWWTPSDRRIFNNKIKDIIEQYEAAASRDGIKFDASIAVGENLADISGLALVEEYLLLFQEANEDIDIIKKVSLEAFYVYMAIQSRQKMYSKAIPAQLKTNPHPLEKYRCNCPLSRSDIFRTIYNIRKGDDMWWKNTDTIW